MGEAQIAWLGKALDERAGKPALVMVHHNPQWDAKDPKAKVSGLAGCGVDITARVPLASAVTPYNLRYLVTKRDRLGHQIQDLYEAERAGLTLSNRLNGHPAAPRV